MAARHLIIVGSYFNLPACVTRQYNYNPLILRSRPSASNFSKLRLIEHNYFSKSIIGSSRTLPIVGASDGSQQLTNQTSSSREIKSSHGLLDQHFKFPLALHMILEIITFIWRLPGIITGFLKNEDKFINTVEEDIDQAADVIQVAAKVVEEVAEGVEKVAKALENDAQRVDTIMDEVKEKTKVAHDEIEEAVGTLEGAVQDVGKSAAKVEVKVKVSKEETIATTNTIPPPTSPTISNSFQGLREVWGPWALILMCSLQATLGLLSSLKAHLAQVNFSHPTYWRFLRKAFVGTLIMASFFHVFGFINTTPLI